MGTENRNCRGKDGNCKDEKLYKKIFLRLNFEKRV